MQPRASVFPRNPAVRIRFFLFDFIRTEQRREGLRLTIPPEFAFLKVEPLEFGLGGVFAVRRGRDDGDFGVCDEIGGGGGGERAVEEEVYLSKRFFDFGGCGNKIKIRLYPFFRFSINRILFAQFKIYMVGFWV